MSTEDRLDGLHNALTGAGKRGEDPGASWKTNNESPMKGLSGVEVLRSNHWARKVVEEKPDDALRTGYYLKLPEEIGQDVAKDLQMQAEQRFDISDKLLDAAKNAQLGGGGALVVGLEDAAKMTDPVDATRIKDVKWVLSLAKDDIVVQQRYQDLDSQEFDQPELYSVSTESGKSMIVHADRVLPIDGLWVPPKVRRQNQGWGDSALRSAISSITRLEAVSAGGATAVSVMHQRILSIDNLQEILEGADGDAKLQSRIESVMMSLSLLGMILIDGQNESLDLQSLSIRDLPLMFDRYVQEAASAAQMPVTKFLGQAPGGLSTDDESGTRFWYDQLQQYRTKKLQRPLQRFFQMLAAARGIFEPVEIVWNPLQEPDRNAEQDSRKKQAEIDAIYIGSNVVTADEVRTSRFGRGEWSYDTQVEELPDLFSEVDEDAE